MKSNLRIAFYLIAAIMVLTGTAAMAQPTFTGGSPQTLTVCQNSSATSINSLLQVTDPATGSTETWTTFSAPTHGTLVAAYSTTSTGGVLLPTGLTYSPTAGYSGADAFTVHVTNGTVTASTVINVTVTALPAAIAGTFSVCTGSTVTLTDATGGGSWTSSTPGVATISSSGITAGLAAGTSVISYAKSGCAVTATVTDKDAPVAIAGASSVCLPGTTTLTDATSNGSWTSSVTSKATINAATGSVGAIAVGTTTMTYTTGCGTAATALMTVIGAPAAITGTPSVCVTATTALANTTTGGTWSTSDPTIATTSSTGVITGIAAGTVTVTYSTGCGSNATVVVTVKGGPAAITGATTVCVGSAITLADVTAGGTWTSGTTARATVVSSTGVVTGVSAGAVNMTYSSGCGVASTYAITVVAAPAAITGTPTACIGAGTILADVTAGGTWSTGDPTIATISAGSVTGIAAGTVAVTYNTGCGTPASVIYTVKGTPASITGAITVCVGSAITLSDATAGGTWSSSTTSRATITTTTGVVTGISAGAVNISYTNGCATVTYPITVIAAPAAITGTTTFCTGTDVILADATAGGTWSTSDPTVATNSGADIYGVASNTSTVTVTYSTGCGSNATTVVTVKGVPAPSSGPTTVCVGSTITLANTTTGGTWTSATTSRATVVASTGVVTGVSAGIVNMTYSTGCGTADTYPITVIAAPVAITGTTNVCAGAGSILSDASAGGTWSTSDVTIASASGSNIVGIAGGTVTVTYSTGCGSNATTLFTVKGLPVAITGPSTVCVGSTITLADATTGGTWSTSSAGHASVNTTTGVVTGVAAGSATISYTTGCGSLAFYAVTAVAAPSAITGTTSTYIGSTTTLADAATGGTWISGTPSVATINAAGTVTGMSAGTSIITYTTGCGSDVTATVTIAGGPAPITGATTVCVGSTISLSESTPGGTWASSSTAKATVSTTGVVTGIAAGALNISYTTGGGTATYAITVIAAPVAVTGTPTVCVGSTTTLADVTAGGTWSVSDATIATVSGGVVSGIADGTVTVTYSTGCGSNATSLVTSKATPTAITGSSTVCVGSTITLSEAASAGTWTSGTPSRATVVSTTGVVTGIAAGAVNITVNNGCGSATDAITVVAAPAAITGTVIECAGADVILADATAGGTWSTSDPTIATNSGSDITGVAAGTVTVTYSTGCGSNATTIVTVKGTPVSITGPATVCVGTTITLADASAGGTWSSSSTGRATVVSTTGVVTGVSAGAVNMTYNNGCGTATYPITVLSTPAAIAGTTSVCTGADVILTDATAGGTWSTSDPTIASVSGGDTYGISNGTVTVTYSNGCGAGSNLLFTVKGVPSSVTGPTTVCVGSTITLSDVTLGGTWTSGTTSRATVVSTTGVVTGVSAGAVNMTYSNGCGTAATYAITVIGTPAAIGGTTTVCAGAGVILTDATTGGTWSTSDPTIASNSAANVTGVVAGTVTVTYSNGCGGGATTVFTVKGTPAAITGTSTVCATSSITLSDVTPGGTWTSSSTARATVVSTTGVVTGVSAGAVTITYSNACGTPATYALTVKALPAVITGTTTICAGTTTTLSDATVGGTWSSATSSVASIGTTGIVTGIAAGTSNISYSVSGCAVGTVMNIHTVPSSITGGSSAICSGSTATFSDATGGGTWVSSNTGVATVSASGVATGLSAGATTISYNTGCGSVPTTSLSVQTIPGLISGSSSFCTGGPVTFTNGVSGGSWSSSNTAVVTINSVSGTATGLTAGSATISYSLTNSCGTNAVTYGTAVQVTGTWLGVTSNSWTDAGNWPCGVIPGSTTNVTIPAGTTYTLSVAANQSANNFSVAPGASVVINGGKTLNINGSYQNNGTISGSGTVAIDGAAAQVMSGTGSVYNVQINNSAGVSVNSGDTVKVDSMLTLTAGTLTTNNGIELVSNASGTASIGTITGGAISGSVTIQTYITGGRRAYRFWAHPFSSSIALSQIEQYIDITGYLGTTNGFTTTASNAPSSFWYNTSVGNSSLGTDPGWTSFTSTNGTGSNAFNPYEGIRIFMRGTKGEGLTGATYTCSPVTINMAGPVNTGNITIPMVKGTSGYADYNLIGNPYPSPVDLGTVISNAQTAGQVTGGAYYVWNPYLGTSGQFITQPIDGTPYYIEGNSSFEVRTASNGSVLNFTESNKATTISAVLLRTTSKEGLTLNIYDTTYHLWDGMYVKFNDAATAGEDDLYDGRKPQGPASLNFYSLASDNAELSLDARPYADGKVIPLGIKSSYAQEFIIKADNAVLPADGDVYLVDKYLDKSVKIQQGTEYHFTITSDNASQGNKRFELRMGAAETANTATVKSMNVQLMPNPATDEVTITYQLKNKENVSVRLLNATGNTVMTQDLGVQQNGSAKLNLESLSSGIYMVEITSGGDKTVSRLVKE